MKVLNSKIILCRNIKLDRNYKNVIDYTETQMLDLCNSNAIASSNNYSFIRLQNTIASKFSYSDCMRANYIAFQNKDYDNKWFFAWIDDVIYKGENNTEIVYTIDCFSTFFRNCTVNQCFVNREHVNDDTVGLHTVDENLNVGDLICDNVKFDNNLGSESYFWWVIACNFDPSNEERYAGVGDYAGYPQGSMWFAWLVNIENSASTINEISNWVYDITEKKHVSDIQCMFALPYQAFSVFNEDVDPDTHMVKVGRGNKINSNEVFAKSVYRLFDDYQAKNNKLYTYPYSFIRISNNAGSYNDYKIEDFNELDIEDMPTDNMTFNLIGIPCLGYSGKLRPKDYRGVTYNEDESLVLGKYPTFSWSSDGFTNWITQNGINMVANIVNSAINSAVSIGTGNVGGGIQSASNTAVSSINSMFQASYIPNTAQGNANAGDISFAYNLNRFKYLHMRPKKEMLEIIDNFFTKYGYKINITKIPNITGRRYFNYVEINQSENCVTGSFPTKYLDVINNAFKSGVTIWHNHANIGNYNLDNAIIS